jgi:uncharacterized protein YciI
MYLLIISYTRPIEEVAPYVEDHSNWVKKYFNEGVFLFAGPKKNKLGGAILTKSIERNLLNEIIEQDSFIANNVAEYQIIDFDCKHTAPGFETLETI